MNRESFFKLIEKYHSPAGRFNYYPRIMNWENNSSQEMWYESVRKEADIIDLYIHIPFCEKLCYFCGCNIKVGAKEDSIQNYIKLLIKEWESYNFSKDIKVQNLYLGGGTPNFLNKEQLKELFENLNFTRTSNYRLHAEVDMRFYNEENFNYLYEQGLKTLSFGVQDFNSKVLQIIGRKTNLQELQENISKLEKYDLESINIDILYGLPEQGDDSIQGLRNFLKESPITSVSLYPFAPVPWFKDFYPLWDSKKPGFLKKYEHYYNLVKVLEEYNFKTVSFGLFTKDTSPLDLAIKDQSVRRTIMGHSFSKSETLIGIGVSAISFTPEIIKQNANVLDVYTHDFLSFKRSHKRSDKEMELEKIFEDLACLRPLNEVQQDILDELINDGLIKKSDTSLTPTKLGQHFIQHIAEKIDSNSK